MARYIVVQTSAVSLFGLFTTPDGADKAAV